MILGEADDRGRDDGKLERREAQSEARDLLPISWRWGGLNGPVGPKLQGSVLGSG
jgi:hypothetical protein